MMMYSRSMIGLTLVTMMIGLVALPSNPQRKIAKGSKKNAPPSSQQEETEIPIEVLVPQTMPVEEVKERVIKIVSDILNGKGRRAVQITGMTKTECASIYPAAVNCYDAIIMIVSEGNHADVVISKLKDLLEKVVDQQGIVVSSNKKGYPYVQLKNDTPYPIAHSYESPYQTDDDNAAVIYGQTFCHDDRILEGIAPGDTWTATSRGLCTVRNIYAYLTLPDDSQLDCTQYYSAGTTYSEFSVIMGGVDGCCVKSSHQDQVCK